MIKGYDQVIKFFHFNDRTQLDMARSVPELENISQLTDQKVLAAFESLVKEILDSDQGEVALLGRRVIEDIILPQFPEIKNQTDETYLKLQKMAGMLKFVNLSIYGMPEIAELIKNYLLDVLVTKLPLTQKFQYVLDANDDSYLDGKIAKDLADAMQLSQGKVGPENLVNSYGKVVTQNLGSWLTDYIQFSSSFAERRTGSLERIQYFKASAFASKLNSNEHNILLKLFRIYDWLAYGGRVEETQQEEISGLPYLKSESFELPTGQEDLEEAGNVGPSLPMGRVVAPKPPVFEEDIPAPRQSGLHISVSNPPDFNSGIKLAPPLPPVNKSASSATPVSLQKIIGKPEPPKAQDKTKIIDQKLEELKKKAGKK